MDVKKKVSLKRNGLLIVSKGTYKRQKSHMPCCGHGALYARN